MSEVLIIEDSVYQRLKTKHILEGAGYHVQQAANGREGLRLALSAHLDCILLDLIMPKMGGLEVLAELQARRVATPVIVVSADIQDSTKQECIALGACNFVNKPPQPEHLLAAISTALASTLITTQVGGQS